MKRKKIVKTGVILIGAGALWAFSAKQVQARTDLCRKRGRRAAYCGILKNPYPVFMLWKPDY